MKKLTYALLFTLLTAMMLPACTSGKKALDNGDYDGAVLRAVNRLRQKPGHKKATQTLRMAYPLAHNWHKDNISRTKASANQFKWESVMNEYAMLNRLYEEINRCPSCMSVVRPTSYTQEYTSARLKAAEVRYAMGQEHLSRGRDGNRVEARNAYNHFLVCSTIYPGFENVSALLDESKFYATLKVLVKDIPVTFKQYDLSQTFFMNKIHEYLHNAPVNEFVRFYTEEEALNTGLTQPDQIVDMEFDYFHVGQVSNHSETIQLTRDSVVIGQVEEIVEHVEVDSAGHKTITREKVPKDVYGTVHAKLHQYSQSLNSTGTLNFLIIDAYTNKVITQEKFRGTHIWEVRWGNFNGDERALDQEHLRIVKNKPPVNPPSPQDLFVEFTVPIYDQITTKMNTFYHNY